MGPIIALNTKGQPLLVENKGASVAWGEDDILVNLNGLSFWIYKDLSSAPVDDVDWEQTKSLAEGDSYTGTIAREKTQ